PPPRNRLPRNQLLNPSLLRQKLRASCTRIVVTPKFIKAPARTRNLTHNNQWHRTTSWPSWVPRVSLGRGLSCLGKGANGTFLPSRCPPRKHRSSSAPIRTRSSFLVTVARPARVSDSPITRAIGLHSSRPLAHGPASAGKAKTHGLKQHT